MQGVGNTIKIVFFCLYSKATPLKIPARGVILHLTPFPLFITLHFSILCEEGKVRKLKERLDCVCMCNKENVASNTIWKGVREGAVNRLCVCLWQCVCVYIYHADIDTHSLCSLRVIPSTAPSLYCTFPQSDLVHACMYYSKHTFVCLCMCVTLVHE